MGGAYFREVFVSGGSTVIKVATHFISEEAESRGIPEKQDFFSCYLFLRYYLDSGSYW